ncbi:MAG: hypothetical protein Q9207_007647 [Kuettlingeria erythrocarpa]
MTVFSVYTRVFSVPFDQEFGPFEKDIRQFSQEIEFEASLASQQAQKQESELQAHERLEAVKHRRILLQVRDSFHRSNTEEKASRLEIDRRRSKKKKMQALDSLSTYDYQKTYKQTRKECVPGTSNWILETSEFKAWEKGTSEGIWCSGKQQWGQESLSSGLACVTAYMMETTSPKDVTSFFFCRFDDQESLKATTIIGSMARQLVSDIPENSFRAFDRETPIAEFLETTLSKTRQYFIILDGLDECDEAQAQEVSKFLQSLLSFPHLQIKTFCCSRPSVLDWLPLKELSQQHISLESVENQGRIASDIGTFISITLEEWLEGDSPKLRIGDANLILTIVQCLKDKAQGMFLWVKLQLLTLREKMSDQQIMDTLSHLPRDLPETFERLLAKFTEADDLDVGSRIFRWVAIAKRPLTVQELREAIGIKPLQDKWDPGRFINDMNKAIARCGNLLFIEEEQQTIHFTHSSVLQYLSSEDINRPLSRHHIDLEQADAGAGAICVTYLSFPMFRTQMVRTSKANFNTTAITSTIVKNSLPAGKSANRLALSLLRRRDKSSKPIQRLLGLEGIAGNDEISRRNAILEQYAFFPYAQKFWLEHTKRKIVPHPGKLWAIWCNLLQDGHLRGSNPWTFEDWEKRPSTVTPWIVENNHCSLAQLLVDCGKGDYLPFLIREAAARGCANLVEVSLGFKNISQKTLDDGLWSAAEGGHLDVVDRLLEAKADINVPPGNDRGRTALQAAARGGDLAVVDRLLQAQADVNAPPGDYNSRTALQAAAEKGYLAVVDRLLQAQADVNAPPGYFGGRTALQAAAEKGHLAVVDRLLQAQADVNAPTGDYAGRTALQAAAEKGHLDVVDRLLEAKADINAPPRNNRGRTALQAAAGGGYLDVVDRLLKVKADVNAPPCVDDGRTALQAAAEKGSLAVVDRLLQAQADVNAPPGDYAGRTALQAAAEKGHLAVVDRLLQVKADVNAPPVDYAGRTALQAAAGEGHLDVVGRLKAAGASHHPSTLGDPVQHLRFRLHESSPTLVLDLIYCPSLLIRTEALSHTLYRAIVTMNEHVQREGRNAPLAAPYTTPEERGYNCVFGIEPSDEATPLSVGVVLEVVQFLRTWMVREEHLGSTAILVYVDGKKAGVGGVRPIVDPAMIDGAASAR